ncbi:MAG TPA: hypothetical protein VKU41_19635, partial [Polyangiaceae bacterium]|nr:hypothetical protein [Polyangiaceae bacterium]
MDTKGTRVAIGARGDRASPWGAVFRTCVAALCVAAAAACSPSSGHKPAAQERTGKTAAALTTSPVQSAWGAPGSVSATFDSAQTLGDVNLVIIGWSDGASVTSVVDSAGNRYQLAVGPTTVAGNWGPFSPSATQSIYVAKNIAPSAANANTVTVSFDQPANVMDLRILEYGGLDPNNPIDTAAVASGAGDTSTVGPLTTTQPNDILVAANYTGAYYSSAAGPGAGLTTRLLTYIADVVEEEAAPTAGSYSASGPLEDGNWGTGGPWIMQAVALRTAASGPGFVQGNFGGTSTQTTAAASATFSAAQTGGDLNVVTVNWADSTNTVTSLTDSAGNAYALAAGPTFLSGMGSQSMYYAKNVAASASNTVTVTMSGASSFVEVRALEYSGLDPTSPLDVATSATGSSLMATTGPVTTSQDNELLVAAVAAGYFVYPPDGYVFELQTGDGVTGNGYTLEDGPAATAGSYTIATAIGDVGSPIPWIQQMLGFKSGGSGGGGGGGLQPTPVDRTVASNVATTTSFLYTGSHPVQVGVDAGTIVPQTAAVVRGRVLGAGGSALPGVTVTVVGHPELGSTLTQSDGTYNMGVNGGGLLRLNYALTGYLPAQRQVTAPWQDYVTAPDVALLQPDSQVTAIDLTSSAMQVARGTPSTDSSGTRQATVLFPPGTQATMTLPGGGTQPLTTLHVRATEFTVGANGPAAMPATLPPTSAYTYAVDLNTDEGLAAGATQLTFSQPVSLYVENFLGFPVGFSVPVGFYDHAQGAWVPSASGVVLKIVSVTGGAADLDVDGDGAADASATLTALGITAAEQQQLAGLYSVGQSLWRAAIAHFSEPDLNPGIGVPDGGPPPVPNPPPPPDGNCNHDQPGSVIHCQRQALGEDLSVAGTPYALHYESDRQIGRQPTPLPITVSGASLPGPVKSIELKVDVAGNHFEQQFPALPNQSTVFTWNGQDAYGRLVQGSQPVTVTLSNIYTPYYRQTDRFGNYGTTLTNVPVRFEDTALQSVWKGALSVWDERPQGLGGWDLSVHHVYDPIGHLIRFGDGTNLTPAVLPRVIQTIAGTGVSYQNANQAALGEGGPATSAVVTPAGVTVGADGSVYMVSSSCVRKVSPAGIITTVAGQCSTASKDNDGYAGDGGPATSGKLSTPVDVAIGPDGSLYVSDFGNQRIRKVDATGIITTVAGSGTGGFSGDGGPATQAKLSGPRGLDVGPDGTLLFVDSGNYRVRRVTPDGIIATVAGNGPGCCATGDGGPATAATLNNPVWARFAKDGGFFVTEPHADIIRRVGPDGVIRALAGTGNQSGVPYSGEGGPATAANLLGPNVMAVGKDDTLYFGDGLSAVRAITADGMIHTVAGGSSPGYGGDHGPAAAALVYSPLGLALAADGTLYVSDNSNNRVRSVAPGLAVFALSSATYNFASKDGARIFQFDVNGRHLQTVDALTNAVLYTFTYDGSGRLATVTDVNGDVTTIHHDASGNPTSIVSPFGEQTTFAVDGNGYLSTVTDAASQQTSCTYSTTGLLQTLTDARGGLHQFTYDPQGRLIEDQDPAGGSTTLTLVSQSNQSSTVTVTSALGHQSTLGTSLSSADVYGRQNTLPDGTHASYSFTPASVGTTTSPDGTTTTETDAPDPRFGMLSPVASVVTKTPSGLTSSRAVTRTDTLSGGNLATLTEQTNLNGNTWTRVFNASSRQWTTTSPVGRTSTMTVDVAGRPTLIAVPNINATSMTYDAHGRLSSMTQGSRTWTTTYDAQGYLASTTDPLSHVISYVNDPLGRPTQTTLQDMRQLLTGYDADGNTTSVTLPSGNVHDFTFTPVDLLSSYVPPSLTSGATNTAYTYDADRELTALARPDGINVAYAYDSAGRLQTTTVPQGALTPSYSASTGKLTSLLAPSGESTAYTYDGFLRTGVTWGGAVAGSLSLGFDKNFRVTSQTVNGTALAFGYDNDGLLTGAGALSLTLDTSNGQLKGTTLGSVTDAYTYDANGLLQSYTASYSGSALYTETLVRDATGRITQKTE